MLNQNRAKRIRQAVAQARTIAVKDTKKCNQGLQEIDKEALRHCKKNVHAKANRVKPVNSV